MNHGDDAAASGPEPRKDRRGVQNAAGRLAGALSSGVRAPAGPSGGAVGSLVSEDDETLAARCRGGDREAFGQLVDRYQARLVRYARGMVGDEEEARDLTQEAFVRAYTDLERFDTRRRFSVWLYGIAAHVCL